MKKLLLLFLLLPVFASAQITIAPIPAYKVCEANTDGFASFSINNYLNTALSQYSAATYTKTAHATQADAQNDINALPANYTNTAAFNQTIYIRVKQINNPTNFGTQTLQLVVNNGPSINNPTPLSICDSSLPNDGITTFDLTVKDNEIKGANCLDCTVSYYTGNPGANPELQPLQNPSNYTNTTTPYTLYVKVQSPSTPDCSSYTTLTLRVLPLPEAPATFPTIYSCTGIYNITQNSSQLPGSYITTYHTTTADADAGINPITDPQNYTSFASAVWIRLAKDTNNPSDPKCYIVSKQNIETVYSTIFLQDGTICVDIDTGSTTRILTLMTNLTPNQFTFSWYKDNVLIPSATSDVLTVFQEGTYKCIANHNALGCQATGEAVVIKSGPAKLLGNGYTINGQTLTVNVEGYGDYTYTLDNSPTQESPVFNNVSFGLHTVTVSDSNDDACDAITLTVNMTTPNAPDAIANQTFGDGATLANLEVTGENIQWYNNDGTTPPPPTEPGDPLPLTTLLTDGTTYYATQTINGVESVSRTAVTAHLTLGLNDTAFAGLQYYPNPVKDVLNIKSTNEIESITIINSLGQMIENVIVSGNAIEADVSHLSVGIYLIKITSGSQSKTLKIIKN